MRELRKDITRERYALARRDVIDRYLFISLIFIEHAHGAMSRYASASLSMAP